MLYQNNSYKGEYFSPMDRGYAPISDALDVIPEMAGLSPADIGISAPPMQNQLEALQAKIRQGAKRIELGFTGRGKGSMGQGNTTPEMYGLEERRDMKELAEINKVILSTHATTQIGNLSGLTEGGFNEMAREQAFNEIRRAIDFAADVTPGGSVVVHTGEFQRPIYDYYGKEGFMQNPAEAGLLEGERKKAVFYIVDKRTGQTFPIRTDQPVPLPVWKVDERGNYAVDKNGQKIPETELDPETGRQRYKIEKREWDYFVNEAEKWNKGHPEKQRTPELQYQIEQVDLQRLQFAGLSSFYGGIERTQSTRERLERVEKALKFYEEIEKNLPEEEKWKIRMNPPAETHVDASHLITPPPSMMPSEYLKEQKKQLEADLQRMVFAEVTYTQQAQQIKETQENLVTIKDYAIKKTADTIARAAMFAMQKSEQMKTKEPIYVAPENIFPETYGSHPQELRTIIKESRKEMAHQLEKMHGYDQKNAEELAERHIKATFDIGHGNTWRKYFAGDPGASIAENDAKFKKWLLDEVYKLAKEGILGHVHVSDNFGYEDEHVDPGMGRAPIKEFIEKIKAGGIKNVIVEPAHQDYRALLGGWRHFGSSIYGMARPAGDTWSDVWRGYFGQTAPPYFLYGEAAPDPEHWVLWSGTRME